MYLIKDLNPEQVKNIYNSVTRNPTADKKKEKKERKSKRIKYSTNEYV